MVSSHQSIGPGIATLPVQIKNVTQCATPTSSEGFAMENEKFNHRILLATIEQQNRKIEDLEMRLELKTGIREFHSRVTALEDLVREHIAPGRTILDPERMIKKHDARIMKLVQHLTSEIKDSRLQRLQYQDVAQRLASTEDRIQDIAEVCRSTAVNARKFHNQQDTLIDAIRFHLNELSRKNRKLVASCKSATESAIAEASDELTAYSKSLAENMTVFMRNRMQSTMRSLTADTLAEVSGRMSELEELLLEDNESLRLELASALAAHREKHDRVSKILADNIDEAFYRMGYSDAELIDLEDPTTSYEDDRGRVKSDNTSRPCAKAELSKAVKNSSTSSSESTGDVAVLKTLGWLGQKLSLKRSAVPLAGHDGSVASNTGVMAKKEVTMKSSDVVSPLTGSTRNPVIQRAKGNSTASVTAGHSTHLTAPGNFEDATSEICNPTAVALSRRYSFDDIVYDKIPTCKSPRCGYSKNGLAAPDKLPNQSHSDKEKRKHWLLTDEGEPESTGELEVQDGTNSLHPGQPPVPGRKHTGLKVKTASPTEDQIAGKTPILCGGLA